MRRFHGDLTLPRNDALRQTVTALPRSDVLPKLARVLGVSVEALLSPATPTPTLLPRGGGPVGRVRKLFDDVSRLPRRQQDKIVEFLRLIVEEVKRRIG